MRVCGIRFEGLPFWLWTIRLAEWSDIYITDTDEVKLRQYHATTWEVMKSKLVIIQAESAKTMPVDVWLVSGTRAFVMAHQKSSGSPMVCWISDGARRKPPDSDGCTWMNISHAMVGGVTKATGIFGTMRMIRVEIQEDPIRRLIDHVIKYSQRPEPCRLPVTEPHYTIADRLSLGRLDLPVVFASGFSRTGWGQRSLGPSELAHAFDLPSFVGWELVEASKMVPIHMFRVVLDAVLASFLGQESCQERAGSRVKREPVPSQVLHQNTCVVQPLPLDRVWLPKLKLWLPGSWTDIVIADKAVKSDNAEVDFHPWNQRIMLVLPCPRHTIVTFEEFALRVWRRSLTSSFLSYMSQQYGSEWVNKERFGRKRDSLVSAPRQGLGSSGKRCRVLRPGWAENMEGGVSTDVSIAGINALYSTEALMFESEEIKRDITKGRLIFEQVLKSKWWEWTYGSSLFFWRWNGKDQVTAARDGMRMYVLSPLPIGRKRATRVKLSPVVQALVAEKIEGMCKRYYLESTGHVANSLDYFAVPKGEADIRVVFDGSSCGLNKTLWAPNFFLPSATSALMLMSFGTWMADMDFGEMFHNFPMEERMRRCAGVELESGARGGGRSFKMLRWTRLFMGMRPSPYNAVRYYYWGEAFARGDPGLSSNPMGYDCIRLNLPGMAQFDPMLPKVMKWKSELGVVAGDVLTFVDDVRITGYSKENCHEVHRQFASRIQYLGMQDAPRKFRPPSQSQAGAWTGTIFKITSQSISKSVSQEKWEKGKMMINQLQQLLDSEKSGRPSINRKQLEKETGFLNHLSMTYEVVIPYLKGFYLTLNSWRPQRDEGDWKVSDKRWKQMLFSRHERGEISEAELDMELFGKEELTVPQMVTASISLISDVKALTAIFAPRVVPVVGVRSKHVITVVYGFGDASGTGLGATFTCGSGLNFRIGVWGSKEDTESSNWKEFTNVVEALEEEEAEGHLDNAEVFMFTDNSTVESCVSRGSSSSAKLLELVIRIQALSMRAGIKINVFHIAGTRMIAQGTDGVSRGFLGHGVMDGEMMSAYVPIQLSSVERSPTLLLPWIREWAGKESTLLSEMGWFQEGHDIEGWDAEKRDGFSRPTIAARRKTFIWAPAPMAAEVALAEMRKARIKRQQSCHIFVCPRLCTCQWLRHLYKAAADFVFEVPVGSKMWSSSMHEPLLIGILFPFIRVKPWQLRGTPKMYAMGRELRQVFKEAPVDASNLLREFWTCCVNLKDLSEPVVRKLLYFK
ncbi:hypothetical protein MHU86_10595 [Fragilaria crotonensis]|nr:hypothetical protein MHU86_10595 [Fragilaria crotonensis]